MDGWWGGGGNKVGQTRGGRRRAAGSAREEGGEVGGHRSRGQQDAKPATRRPLALFIHAITAALKQDIQPARVVG